MHNFWHNLGQVFGPTISTILIYFFGAISQTILTWFNKKKPQSHESVAETYEFNFKIAVATERCLELMGPNAMRVYYTKFHNGDYFDDGSPIQKKSRVYEALRPGVAPVIDKYSTILVSRIIDEIRLIKEIGPSYTYVSDLPRKTFRYICEQFGVQAVAREAVYNGVPHPKNLIGFVGVDFDSDREDKKPQIPESLKELGVLANKIGKLAENYKG